ncbi:hypothetical protein BGZ79_003282, partial [Entomortierella chlamydospora]
MAPVTRSEIPGGFFHPNFSSPGRLDLQAKTSDSSLQLQYGTRVKRVTPPTGINGGGGGGGGAGGINGNGFGTVSTNGGYANGGPIRTSGTGTHVYANLPVVDQYGVGNGGAAGY